MVSSTRDTDRREVGVVPVLSLVEVKVHRGLELIDLLWRWTESTAPVVVVVVTCT